MKEAIIIILGLIISLSVFGIGLYYRVKEKEDKESRKIYSVIMGISAVICIAIALKIVIFGL